MGPKQQLLIRPAAASDEAFVYATYLRNSWYSKDNTTTLPKATWMRLMHQRLERMLRETPPVVACLADDPDTILGYRLQDGDKTFTYVKLAWREPKLGVTRALEEAKERL
jgi:hypothetical protein